MKFVDDANSIIYDPTCVMCIYRIYLYLQQCAGDHLTLPHAGFIGYLVLLVIWRSRVYYPWATCGLILLPILSRKELNYFAHIAYFVYGFCERLQGNRAENYYIRRNSTKIGKCESAVSNAP